MGGMALNTRPVQADIGITPSPLNANLTDMRALHQLHLTHVAPILCSCADFPPDLFLLVVGGVAAVVSTLDMNTGVLTGCPPVASRLERITLWLGAPSWSGPVPPRWDYSFATC